MSFLKRLELNNFRIFTEPANFEFAPITLLVGANNSGKSTLIRALQVLSESATKDGLLYLLEKGSETDYRIFTDLFPFSLKTTSSDCVIGYKIAVANENAEIFDVSLEYRADSSDRMGILCSLQIVDEQTGKILVENSDDFWNAGVERYYKRLFVEEIDNDTYTIKKEEFDRIKLIADFFKEKIIYLPASRYKSQKEFNRKDDSFLSRKLFAIADGNLKIFNQINKDQTSTNPFEDFSVWNPKHGKEFVFTNRMVKSLFSLGNSVVFLQNTQSGNYELSLVKSGDDKINIADLGFGVSNLISLLLSIDIATSDYEGKQLVRTIDNETLVRREKKYSQKIIICEEPELSLHPNYQSILADVFVSAYKDYGVNFILETHSEYIIRKLQYLVARKDIPSKDIAVYYFPDKTTAQVPYKIEILEDGRLNKPFGKGFYDEASNIMMSILTGENIN